MVMAAGQPASAICQSEYAQCHSSCCPEALLWHCAEEDGLYVLLKGGVVLPQRGNWAWRLQACPSRSGPLAEAAPWAFTLPRRRGIPMHCEDASWLL